MISWSKFTGNLQLSKDKWKHNIPKNKGTSLINNGLEEVVEVSETSKDFKSSDYQEIKRWKCSGAISSFDSDK